MHHLLKALLGALLVVAAFFAGVVVVAIAAVVGAGIYLTRRFLRPASGMTRRNPHAHAPAASRGGATAGDVIDVTAIELPVDSNLK